ncbi:MAG: tyrosine recombinase [Acidimicrobiales bacterium]
MSVARAVTPVSGSTDGLPTVALEFLDWLAVERGRAANTLAAYRRDIGRWVVHLGAVHRDLLDAGEADVIAFVESLRGAELAPSSVTRALVAVRGLHRFLVAEQLRLDDPTADVEVPRPPRGLPKALSEEQIESLMAALVGDDPVARRDRAIIEVLYGTGARISELVGLSLGDVDLHDGLARLTGKGARERIVPLGRHSAAALERWFAPGGRVALEPTRWARRGDAEAVFLTRRGGRLGRQGAWGVVRRWGREAGLEGVLSPHVLRHSCATHMLDHGADIRTVQELLGHASVSTTQVYTRVSTERLRAVYRAAHPRATGP